MTTGSLLAGQPRGKCLPETVKRSYFGLNGEADASIVLLLPIVGQVDCQSGVTNGVVQPESEADPIRPPFVSFADIEDRLIVRVTRKPAEAIGELLDVSCTEIEILGA